MSISWHTPFTLRCPLHGNGFKPSSPVTHRQVKLECMRINQLEDFFLDPPKPLIFLPQFSQVFCPTLASFSVTSERAELLFLLPRSEKRLREKGGGYCDCVSRRMGEQPQNKNIYFCNCCCFVPRILFLVLPFLVPFSLFINSFFSYAGHGRTVAFIFSIDIQQFSINFLTIHTILQYIPYDCNIVLGGHLRHYINYQLYSNNFTSVEKTTFIRRRIFKTIFFWYNQEAKTTFINNDGVSPIRDTNTISST